MILVALAQPRISLCQVYAFCTNQSLGQFITGFIGPAFNIAGLLLIFYFIFAAFKYLTAGGDKQATVDARNMITHAVIGFLALMLLFLVVEWLPFALGGLFDIVK